MLPLQPAGGALPADSATDRVATERHLLLCILRSPEGCDLLISSLAAAARHYRRASVCAPFPWELFGGAAGGGARDFGALQACLAALPGLAELAQPGGLAALPGAQLRLLAWCLLGRASSDGSAPAGAQPRASSADACPGSSPPAVASPGVSASAPAAPRSALPRRNSSGEASRVAPPAGHSQIGAEQAARQQLQQGTQVDAQERASSSRAALSAKPRAPSAAQAAAPPPRLRRASMAEVAAALENCTGWPPHAHGGSMRPTFILAVDAPPAPHVGAQPAAAAACSQSAQRSESPELCSASCGRSAARPEPGASGCGTGGSSIPRMPESLAAGSGAPSGSRAPPPGLGAQLSLAAEPSSAAHPDKGAQLGLGSQRNSAAEPSSTAQLGAGAQLGPGSKHSSGDSRAAVAFHGTSMENLHSILRRGLLNLSGTRGERTGALFGEGIYLSTDLAVAFSFARPQPGWPRSALGGRLRCLLVCRVAPSAAEELPGKPGGAKLPRSYLVVRQPERARVAFIFVYNDEVQSSARAGWSWARLVVAAYCALLLALAAAQNAPPWLRRRLRGWLGARAGSLF